MFTRVLFGSSDLVRVCVKIFLGFLVFAGFNVSTYEFIWGLSNISRFQLGIISLTLKNLIEVNWISISTLKWVSLDCTWLTISMFFSRFYWILTPFLVASLIRFDWILPRWTISRTRWTGFFVQVATFSLFQLGFVGSHRIVCAVFIALIGFSWGMEKPDKCVNQWPDRATGLRRKLTCSVFQWTARRSRPVTHPKQKRDTRSRRVRSASHSALAD